MKVCKKYSHITAVALLLATFLLIVPFGNCGRILVVFPIASKSMTNLFRPLVKGLVDRGHEVTAVTPVRLKIRSPLLTEMMPVQLSSNFTTFPDAFVIRREATLFKYPMEFQTTNCHKVYQNKEFRKLENESFDVIVVNFVYNDCFAGLFHKIGSPIIIVGTLPLPSSYTELLGNHMPSSAVPISLLGDISAELTFIQRTKNFLYNIYFGIMLNVWMRPSLENIYRHYLGRDLPPILEIYRKQVSMYLMNAHFSITNPRPLLPSVVEVGGLHLGGDIRGRPLPNELDEFVSGAKDGFIIFSMGSIVKASQMPESVRLAFVEAFRKLNQRVIWKWEDDEGMSDLPDNVKLARWLPQRDLLRHPNVRLFITHGGLLSTEEAVYFGVPVLGMPVFIDQDANMRQAEILGFGVKGEILDLTEPKLTPLIRKVLDEHRYMQKAKELSAIFRDQPEDPLHRGVYWTEYVMRYKGAYHLRSSGMHLNPLQFYCVDVVAFLIFFVVASTFIAFNLVKLLAKVFVLILATKGVDTRDKNDKQKKN